MTLAPFRAMTERAGRRRKRAKDGVEALRPKLLPTLLALAFLAPPAHAGTPSPTWPLLWPETASTSSTLHPDRQIELTAREIGQMILIGFPGQEPGEAWPARAAAMIADGRVGGVILFGHNVRNPDQVRRLTAGLLAAGGRLPPFIAIDQEGGRIQRLSRRQGFQGLPSARFVATQSLCEAGADYRTTAAELASLHINVNLGPVVDLDINPRSPAIGLLARSYGADPATVIAYAEQFIDAHDAAGVLTVAKHFPGHGSAVLDPHKRVVDISHTWQPAELQPFRFLARQGSIAMIMVGHLIHPRFSDGDRPASLSRRAMTDELRDRLGFGGLIVTDDLGMDAISDRYSAEDAAVMAVAAGADILVFANQPSADTSLVDRIVAAVGGAVASGRVPMAAIDRSYARVLAAKQRLAERAAAPVLPFTDAAAPGADPQASPAAFKREGAVTVAEACKTGPQD